MESPQIEVISSVTDPDAQEIMKVTGFVGKSVAWAGKIENPKTIANTINNIPLFLFMVLLLSLNEMFNLFSSKKNEKSLWSIKSERTRSHRRNDID